MCVVGGGDGDQLDGFVGEEFVGGAVDFGVGVGLGGFVAAALDDGGKLEAGDGVDEGGVEDAASEAEADDGGANGFSHSLKVKQEASWKLNLMRKS